MKYRFQEQLTNLTTCLMKAHKQSEAKRLAAEFNTIIEKLIELNKRNPMPSWRAKFKTVMVKIDKSELAEMDKTFRREFIKNGLIKAVGKMADYQIILNAAGWFEKGVLEEKDLADIQTYIDQAHDEE